MTSPASRAKRDCPSHEPRQQACQEVRWLHPEQRPRFPLSVTSVSPPRSPGTRSFWLTSRPRSTGAARTCAASSGTRHIGSSSGYATNRTGFADAVARVCRRLHHREGPCSGPAAVDARSLRAAASPAGPCPKSTSARRWSRSAARREKVAFFCLILPHSNVWFVKAACPRETTEACRRLRGRRRRPSGGRRQAGEGCLLLPDPAPFQRLVRQDPFEGDDGGLPRRRCQRLHLPRRGSALDPLRHRPEDRMAVRCCP